MNIIEALNWRYAVRAFAPQRIDEHKLAQLLDATRLSATSYGLQPYRLIVVDDIDVRRQLLPCSYGQDKIVNCSHLVVFAAEKHINGDLIDRYIRSVADTRGIALDELTDLAAHMKSVFNDMSATRKKEWAHQQVHIALGTLLTAAAALHIDSCPMGGIEADGYDKVLQLSERDLETSVICALGMRHPEDANAHLPKVRYPASEMIVKV
jgi:nitroreductase